MCGTSDFYDNTDALESYNWKEDGIQAAIENNFKKLPLKENYQPFSSDVQTKFGQNSTAFTNGEPESKLKVNVYGRKN